MIRYRNRMVFTAHVDVPGIEQHLNLNLLSSIML